MIWCCSKKCFKFVLSQSKSIPHRRGALMKMRESWNPVPKGSTSSPTKRNFRVQKISESGLHKWFLQGSNRTEYRGETILPRSPLLVFDFHRFPGKKVSGNTTIRKNEHLSCTKGASWRTDFAEDQEPQIPLLLIPVRKQKLSEPSTSRRQENPSETR